jgi:putative ABC transport system permease protein
VIDRGVYRDLWQDPTLSFTDVRVKPGIALAEAKAQIAEALRGSTTYFLYEIADLKGVARNAIDASLALANVQVVIALVVGFLGIVNTLLISVLQRTREIGLLRAVGARRAQIRRIVGIEAILIALVGGALGVGIGCLGAALPLRMFTLRLAGFWVPFEMPWPTIALALAVSLALGILASLLPARRAAAASLVAAIAYE